MSEQDHDNDRLTDWLDGPEPHDGMTLRVYFAAKAMQALLVRHPMDPYGFKDCAMRSFSMADAMLKEMQR